MFPLLGSNHRRAIRHELSRQKCGDTGGTPAPEPSNDLPLRPISNALCPRDLGLVEAGRSRRTGRAPTIAKVWRLSSPMPPAEPVASGSAVLDFHGGRRQSSPAIAAPRAIETPTCAPGPSRPGSLRRRPKSNPPPEDLHEHRLHLPPGMASSISSPTPCLDLRIIARWSERRQLGHAVFVTKTVDLALRLVLASGRAMRNLRPFGTDRLYLVPKARGGTSPTDDSDRRRRRRPARRPRP